MSQWIKVVTEPLGLAGFAIFLIFGYLARVKKTDERRWLSPAAVAIAAVALLGGLGLAYLKLPKPTPSPLQTGNKLSVPVQEQTNKVQQISSGAGSPNVQGIQGDVTVTVDQSTGKTAGIKPPASKVVPGDK